MSATAASAAAAAATSPSAAHAFWSAESGERARAIFAVEGMRCAACARSIERAVSAVAGVERASVNGATARVAVDWNPHRTSLAQILAAVTQAGFRPLPLAGEATAQAWRIERRLALKRIGLAGLGMMQTMMFIVGIYASARKGIDPAIAQYLKLVSLMVSTPVLLYSGAPFFRGAWLAVRSRSLGMDVPVAIALALAWGASAWNTLRGSGETYFDSVTMFIFLLLVGRYLEMTVRHRNLSASEALTRSLPSTAMRIGPDGAGRRIPVGEIAIGDRLSIPRGAVIPVDVSLLAGRALVDESLVTGEATPIERHAGDSLPGGCVNVGNPVQVVANSTVARSALANVVALLERAQAERPRLASAADRAAGRFVVAILVVAAITACAWLVIDPTRAFAAVLAVLVVTCPCALSLATPAAVAAATTRLARSGILVTRADAIERLAGIDTVVLDKTGTLTLGRLRVAATRLLGSGPGERDALRIAAALERQSDHPIGLAFADYADPAIIASAVREDSGLGLEGEVAGVTWRLGRRQWVTGGGEDVGAVTDAVTDADVSDGVASSGVYLGREGRPIALFELTDTLRPEAARAVAALCSLGLEVVIASGDRPASVAAVAGALGVARAHAGLRPERKIEIVRELQADGRRVLMIGDGINDGPVLAAADVSCAMGQGSAIAQVAADLLLLNESLQSVVEAIGTSRGALRVIRQNLGWALIYNFAAVPLAAFGLVLPWVAALGMSLSSLGVVLNARRIATRAAPVGAGTIVAATPHPTEAPSA